MVDWLPISFFMTQGEKRKVFLGSQVWKLLGHQSDSKSRQLTFSSSTLLLLSSQSCSKDLFHVKTFDSRAHYIDLSYDHVVVFKQCFFEMEAE